jgi:hypothetical protein
VSAIILFMAGIAAIAGWWLSQQGLAAKPCAVLGPPDGQELYDQWEAYDGFVESADTLMIADAPEEGPGFSAWCGIWAGIRWLSWFERRALVSGIAKSQISTATGVLIGELLRTR